MSSWYKVTVPFREATAAGKGRSLEESFQAVFMASGVPEDAALFGDRSDDFEHYFYYFSPVAATLAKILVELYEGVACSPPTGERLALLVGNGDPIKKLLQRSDR